MNVAWTSVSNLDKKMLDNLPSEKEAGNLVFAKFNILKKKYHTKLPTP